MCRIQIGSNDTVVHVVLVDEEQTVGQYLSVAVKHGQVVNACWQLLDRKFDG